MSKSVYSIVLSDDVVSAIDEMAYSLGTNRSGLINSILAEKVCYVTPEQRVQNIIDAVLDNIRGSMIFQPLQTAATASLSLKSAFKYKYNPTVRYAIAINPTDTLLGELKVLLRTQNSLLLSELDNFLHKWVQWEANYYMHNNCLKAPVQYTIGAGKFSRQLALPGSGANGEEDFANAIWEYINIFDSVMKQYFHNGEDSAENFYIQHIKQCKYNI